MPGLRKGVIAGAVCAVCWGGCAPSPGPPPSGNAADPTNGGAAYVGAAACGACHSGVAATHERHGHARVLTAVQGGPPEFPASVHRLGIPGPPEGFDWSDIAYIIGGYTRKARFIGVDGFVLTTGLTNVPAQWSLEYPPNGTTAGFVDVDAAAEQAIPYRYDCFRCHTTGARPQNPDHPAFQENRPGFRGTWVEAGVQCEACHGPGGRHFMTEGLDVRVDPSAIFVSTKPGDTCGPCHTRGENPTVILGDGGYLASYQQYPELLASGGHAALACTTCHDPHRSVTYDRANAIRNACTDCHADQNMGKHEGKVFTRGDYTEVLSCESCHMPFAGKSASTAPPEVVGKLGRMGDTRTHIFRIDSASVDYTDMFTEDLSQVRTDAEGRASVTLDFVCARCHNGIGAFDIEPRFLPDIAANMHFISEP